MRRLKAGWYILLYHDVSWEENWFLSSLGGTCPPDLLRAHIRTVQTLGELVSIEEGRRRLLEGRIRSPIFSVWFDDGLSGVIKYAVPILEEVGVTGAISVCSAFINQKDFFWRFKLSYLASIDGLRFLRSRLRKMGFRNVDTVRGFTISNFSERLCGEIDSVFQRFTTKEFREDAFRMFFDWSAVLSLAERGWVIANHTARHYPVGVDGCLHLFGEEFQECERELSKICGKPSEYWVLPFDYGTSERVFDSIKEHLVGRHLVLVGNRANFCVKREHARVLYRYYVPIVSERLLKGFFRTGKIGWGNGFL